MAALATMLVRYRRFRHILIFERRDWPDRLVFALGLGLPARGRRRRPAAAQLRRGRPDARRRLPGRAHRRPLRGRARRRAASACPPLVAGEFGALPFAVGCGFAGGGLRELCPKEAIWHFSPFVFTDLPGRVWQHGPAACTIDWQVVLLLAPVGARAAPAGARRALRRAPRLFYLPAELVLDVDASSLLATVLAVATPIKIWNNARIEHRLQEQEKLLLAAKIEALASQINPHFLFNTLTSISSLIRTQPETARMLIIKLSGLLRRLHAQRRSLRHAARGARRRSTSTSTSRSSASGRSCSVDKADRPDTLDVIVPSMILQPLVENSIKHGLSRKVGGGRITHPKPPRATATRSSRSRTTGSG